MKIRNFETLRAGMQTWPLLGSHCWEDTGCHGMPLEIRNLEKAGMHTWTLLGKRCWEAVEGHGKPPEIHNFESGNAYLATAGKPLLGVHAKPR